MSHLRPVRPRGLADPLKGRLRRLLGGKRTPGRQQLPAFDGERWFGDHFDYAAEEIIHLLDREGMTLRGRDVADIGAGDGIIDLGLVLKGEPKTLVGFDIGATDAAALLAQAQAHGVATELPPNLSFARSEPTAIPAEAASFDLVVSWSAFEHVADPPALLREVQRVLRPGGILLIQIWPLYHSEHGGHLWDWFPEEPFLALRHSPPEIAGMARARADGDSGGVEARLQIYRTLNRVTLDELQEALVGAGFSILNVELMTNTIRVPPGLDRQFSLTDLAITGVKLIASAS